MTASTAPGFLENSIASPGIAAMMLALTQTIYDEDMAKHMVAKKGLKAVVTEVGGKTSFYDFCTSQQILDTNHKKIYNKNYLLVRYPFVMQLAILSWRQIV